MVTEEQCKKEALDFYQKNGRFPKAKEIFLGPFSFSMSTIYSLFINFKIFKEYCNVSITKDDIINWATSQYVFPTSNDWIKSKGAPCTLSVLKKFWKTYDDFKYECGQIDLGNAKNWQDVLQSLKSRTILENECWIWQGYIFNGYGRIHFRNQYWYAHRLSYLAADNKLDNEEIDHICKNTKCINPDHLHCVSHAENMKNRIQILSRNKPKIIKPYNLTGQDFKNWALKISIPNNDCLIYPNTTILGYPKARIEGKQVLVHRYIIDAVSGQEVSHLCNNKGCINPDHLKIISHAENMQNSYSRLSEEQIVNILLDAKEWKGKKGDFDREQSLLYNVSINIIQNIRTGRTYKHIFNQLISA